jgi:hypothetical protein
LKCHLVGVEIPGRGFISCWSLPYLASDSNLVSDRTKMYLPAYLRT